MTDKENCEQYIKRMTGTTDGELFKPTGWISVQDYIYRNKRMLFVQCYTDCIYKPGQPIAQFWIRPEESIHLAWQFVEHSKIWRKLKRGKQ